MRLFKRRRRHYSLCPECDELVTEYDGLCPGCGLGLARLSRAQPIAIRRASWPELDHDADVVDDINGGYTVGPVSFE